MTNKQKAGGHFTVFVVFVMFFYIYFFVYVIYLLEHYMKLIRKAGPHNKCAWKDG